MENRSSKSGKFLYGTIMVLIYLGMAALLLFSDLFNIQFTYRIIIGVLFLIYGIFRGYRIWQ